MKKIIRLLAVLCTVAAAASCAKVSTETIEVNTLVKCSIVADLEPTKATLDGVKVKWEAGDKIAVYDGTAKREFALVSGAGTSSAMFEGEVEAAATTLSAVSPFCAAGNEAGQYTLPRTQTISAGKDIDSSAMIMVAAPVAKGNPFTFKNVCGVVKLTAPAGAVKVKVAAGSNYYITFPEALSADATCKVVIPACENKTIAVRVWTADKEYEKTSTNLFTIAAGMVKNLGNVKGSEVAHSEEWFVKAGAKGTGRSWADAIDLGDCLDQCDETDVIKVAAGEYQPTQYLNGTTDEFRTFYVTKNVKIIGGYPADGGDVANPSANKVFLGKNANVNHVMVVGAPLSETSMVEIDGINITDNVNSITKHGSTTINNTFFYNTYSGGLYLLGSRGKMSNGCISNITATYCGGVFIGENSDWEFCDFVFENNSTPNQWGAAVHNGGTVTFRRCKFLNNLSNDGGAALYNMSPDKYPVYAYFYDCFICGNGVRSTTKWRPNVMYLRENSNTLIVNTTIADNSGRGSVCAVYGTSSYPSQCVLVNSTISGNTSTEGFTAGFHQGKTSTLKVYNSVVSGNTSSGFKGISMGNDVDVISEEKSEYIGYSISNTSLWADNSSTANQFDPATMIGAQTNGVCALIGTSNPAKTEGMTVAQLQAITLGWGKGIEASELAVDQKGNARTGKVMGAYVGE